MLKNIIFDFGAVLIDWNPHYLYDTYFGDVEKSTWFLNNICQSEWNAQMDAGKTFAQGIAELTQQHPEWTEAIAVYRSRWIEMIGGEIPGMSVLLDDLRARGLKLYGLSNWAAETFDEVESKYDIFKKLDGMVISGREKMAKPNAEIYHRLLQRYNLNPSECVFVDDSEVNIKGGEACGIAGIRFENAEQVRQDLFRLLENTPPNLL